jgi:hypothetical protein
LRGTQGEVEVPSLTAPFNRCVAGDIVLADTANGGRPDIDVAPVATAAAVKAAANDDVTGGNKSPPREPFLRLNTAARAGCPVG